jgi:hypothetical protein
MSVDSFGRGVPQSSAATIDTTLYSNTVTAHDVLTYSIPLGALGPNGIIRWSLFVALTQATGVNRTLLADVTLDNAVSGAFTFTQSTADIPTGTAPVMRFDGIIQNQNDAASQKGRIELDVIRAGAIYPILAAIAGITVDTDAAASTLTLALGMSSASASFSFAAVFGTVESLYLP